MLMIVPVGLWLSHQSNPDHVLHYKLSYVYLINTQKAKLFSLYRSPIWWANKLPPILQQAQ